MRSVSRRAARRPRLHASVCRRHLWPNFGVAKDPEQPGVIGRQDSLRLGPMPDSPNVPPLGGWSYALDTTTCNYKIWQSQDGKLWYEEKYPDKDDHGNDSALGEVLPVGDRRLPPAPETYVFAAMWGCIINGGTGVIWFKKKTLFTGDRLESMYIPLLTKDGKSGDEQDFKAHIFSASPRSLDTVPTQADPEAKKMERHTYSSGHPDEIPMGTIHSFKRYQGRKRQRIRWAIQFCCICAALAVQWAMWDGLFEILDPID